jgi:predicted flap endonuclease-1-like 5' DNA nuclease
MSFHIRWPTQFGLITQGFRERPEFYGKFGLPGHEGIDFQAPDGSEIYAIADGAVSDVRLDGDSDKLNKPYGNQVRVRHDGGYESIYAHLMQATVSVGQPVKAGQLIGLADNTGNSFGAHLHFTVKKQGASQTGETDFPWDIIDPTPYLEPFGGGAPVQPEPPAQPTIQVQVTSPQVGHLNIRSAPYASAGLVTQAPDGSMLGALEAEDVARRKIGQQNQWLWVCTSEGQMGYAAAWYLRLPEGTAPPAAPAISVVVDSQGVPLKVRSGPGTQYAILVEVPDGTRLQALESEQATQSKVGQQGQWLQVQTSQGVAGYSAAWYMRLQVAPAVAFALPVEEAELAEERKLVHADDLKRILGIGPKTEAALQAIGIAIYEQLASLKPKQLEALLKEKGIRAQNVPTWPKQARLLAEGRRKALESFQKKLKK